MGPRLGVHGAEPPALLFPHFFGKKWGRRRRPKLRIVRFRAGPKAHSLRWASSPHRTRCAAVGGFAALRMRRAPCGYFAGLRRGPQLPQAPANGAGGNARSVYALSVQPTAAVSPRFGGRRGNTPGPFFPPISSGRNGGARRVGGAGGASDKNPAKPPSKKRPAPGASRQADGAPRSSRPTSSAQAADRSLPRKRESSFPPLCLLSPPNPLRWASAGAPLGGRILSAPTGLAVGRPSAGLHSPS